MNRSLLTVLIASAIVILPDATNAVVPTSDTHAAEGKTAPSEKEGIGTTLEKERNEFVATAEKDLRQLKTDLRALKAKAAAATRDERAELQRQTRNIERQTKLAGQKLKGLKSAAPERWQEFKADVAGAIGSAKQSIEKLKRDEPPNKSGQG